MFPSKFQNITIEIERRIRRGYYIGHLPDNTTLQSEFFVARQTMTDALRPLVQQGILHCTATRNGLEIRTDMLRHGDIVLVSPTASIEQLERDISLDGFVPRLWKPGTLSQFRSIVEGRPAGVLFMTSTLNVDMVHILERCKVPFVSCNQLPILSPLVNTLDYDMEMDLKWFLEGLVNCGYQRIAVFPFGRVEGYNELLSKTFCRLKRKMGLPVEKYDRLAYAWNLPIAERILNFFEATRNASSRPQAVVSFYDFREDIVSLKKKVGFKMPDDILLVSVVSKSSSPRPCPGFVTVNSTQAQWRLWAEGYHFLKEVMLGLHRHPIQRTVSRTFKLREPIPVVG